MGSYLQEAVRGLVDAGLSVEEVGVLCSAMKNGVLMDPKVGPAVRKRTLSDGEIRFRFIEQAEGWVRGWEYPETLLPHARHFAVQVANLLLS